MRWHLTTERRQQLERQAWWAAMWRDPGVAVYEELELTPEQRGAAHDAASCFPTANSLLLADNCDTQIVGESLALGGKMLLTSKASGLPGRRPDWCDGRASRAVGRERWMQAGIAPWSARPAPSK